MCAVLSVTMADLQMKLLRKKIQKRNEKDRERKLQKKKRKDEVIEEGEGEDGECLMAR